MTKYPYVPGHYGSDTAVAAAVSMQNAAPYIAGKVLAEVAASGPAGRTGDEVANPLGLDKYAVRPRLAELRQRGDIVDSGRRRINESGRKAIVWILPQFAPTQGGGHHE